MPGIQAGEAGNMHIHEILAQGSAAAEVFRLRAELAHNIPPERGPAFKVFRDQPVIPDHGEGLDDDLPGIAGVRQGFQIAVHAGGEHKLAHRGGGIARLTALKHVSIG